MRTGITLRNMNGLSLTLIVFNITKTCMTKGYHKSQH